MHICYNLILHSIFYMFRAWKAHHQEDTCNNTGIMVKYMSMYMVSYQCVDKLELQ